MMKRWMLATVLGAVCGAQAGPAVAREAEADTPRDVAEARLRPLARMRPATYADVYCGGYIAPKGEAAGGFAAGGVHTPNTTKFVDGDLIYLAGGGYALGQRLMLVRELSRYETVALFAEQAELLAAAGQPYADLGQAHVVDTRGKLAIAHMDYSCQPVVPGDLVLPAEERLVPEAPEPFVFDRFAPSGAGLKGRIVLARDSDELLGTGAAVYLSVGAAQGVKVGDRFRIRRAYAADLRDAADSLSFLAAQGENNQKHAPKTSGRGGTRKKGREPVIDVSELPSRGMGELVITHVTQTSATGIIGFALEDVHVGDEVERE